MKIKRKGNLIHRTLITLGLIFVVSTGISVVATQLGFPNIGVSPVVNVSSAGSCEDAASAARSCCGFSVYFSVQFGGLLTGASATQEQCDQWYEEDLTECSLGDL